MAIEDVGLAPSTLVFIVLGLTLGAFIWGRFRYDLVALAALLGSVMLGLVPADDAFLGFGHPAVITVAAVLVLSRGFERSGLVDIIADQIFKVGERLVLQLLVLVGTVVVLSGIMNNVGALALLLPVAMRLAREHNTSPSLLLMPLAFGSLLGGLITLIGTPEYHYFQLPSRRCGRQFQHVQLCTGRHCRGAGRVGVYRAGGLAFNPQAQRTSLRRRHV